jgi:hypothetical protein
MVDHVLEDSLALMIAVVNICHALHFQTIVVFRQEDPESYPRTFHHPLNLHQAIS